MKKKYRRAIFYSIGVIWFALLSPILMLGMIGELCGKLFEWSCELYPGVWLITKLKVRDDDPD